MNTLQCHRISKPTGCCFVSSGHTHQSPEQSRTSLHSRNSGSLLSKKYQSYTFFYSPYQTPKSPCLAKTTLTNSFKPIQISAVPPALASLWKVSMSPVNLQSRLQKPARPMQDNEVIAMNCLTIWKFSSIYLNLGPAAKRQYHSCLELALRDHSSQQFPESWQDLSM